MIDLHSHILPGLDDGATDLAGARKVIGDEPLARWLTESVPEAILRDEPLPPRPTPTRRPGLLARLLGG